MSAHAIVWRLRWYASVGAALLRMWRLQFSLAWSARQVSDQCKLWTLCAVDGTRQSLRLLMGAWRWFALADDYASERRYLKRLANELARHCPARLPGCLESAVSRRLQRAALASWITNLCGRQPSPDVLNKLEHSKHAAWVVRRWLCLCGAHAGLATREALRSNLGLLGVHVFYEVRTDLPLAPPPRDVGILRAWKRSYRQSRARDRLLRYSAARFQLLCETNQHAVALLVQLNTGFAPQSAATSDSTGWVKLCHRRIEHYLQRELALAAIEGALETGELSFDAATSTSS